MYILGVNAYHGDSSACIIKDGEIIARRRGRFRRIKHWAGFPSEAIKYCLEEAGISPLEIDHVEYRAIPVLIYIEKCCCFIKSSKFFFVKRSISKYG
jgi:carbamoyltransferase